MEKNWVLVHKFKESCRKGILNDVSENDQKQYFYTLHKVLSSWLKSLPEIAFYVWERLKLHSGEVKFEAAHIKKNAIFSMSATHISAWGNICWYNKPIMFVEIILLIRIIFVFIWNVRLYLILWKVKGNWFLVNWWKGNWLLANFAFLTYAKW